MSYNTIQTLEGTPTTLSIRIKGEIGYIFSLIEHQLLRIILYSNEYKANERNDYKPIKIKQLRYSSKVSKALSAIKSSKHNFKINYEFLFKFLAESADYRNLMIHGEYLWDINDLNTFEVWEVFENEEEGVQYHEKIKKSMKDVYQYNSDLMSCYNFLVPISDFFEKRSLNKF
jgi:hypothetical protein